MNFGDFLMREVGEVKENSQTGLNLQEGYDKSNIHFLQP